MNKEVRLKLVSEARCDFEEDLMTLPVGERLQQVEQFLVDMMDHTEQSEEENFYPCYS